MGASTSTRPRRASSDLTQGRRRTHQRSASGTFLKTDSNLLTPWYPAANTPVDSRSGSPHSLRSSFGRIPENDDAVDHANPDEGRQQRSNSRSLLGRLIRRKRTCTSSSLGSTSTVEGLDTAICIEVPQDKTTPNILESGTDVSCSDIGLEKALSSEVKNTNSDEKEDELDDVFFNVASRPRLASEESSCSEEVPRPRLASAESSCSEEAPAPQDNQVEKKRRSETLIYKASVAEKAVQTDQEEYAESRGGSVPCDHCRRRCFCFRNDPYDSNSSTQSLKLNVDEKSKRRRRRWSPLIKKRQLLMTQTVPANQSLSNINHHNMAYSSTAMQPRLPGFHGQRADNPHQLPTCLRPQSSVSSSSSSSKRWHIQYRQNRRRRRTFSEDKVDELDSPASSQCANTNSDPSLYSEKYCCNVDEHRPSDNIRRGRLYTLCLQKAKMPLVKSSSYSPTVPLRRQTWSEKSRQPTTQFEGPKKNKGFLYLLRNLRSSCSETDISMEHRRSVDSNGYVDPFYITRNFNRLNLKRLSLSHPNLNSGLKFKGSTTPPSSLKGRVSAAVGRLERALAGRSIGRTYSLESQQSTSNGWNSDLPGSPTDSDAAAYTYSKHRHDPDAEHGYMTFDPELNPPLRRPRRLLSSSCSSAPSSPGFQDGINAGFDDGTSNTGCEEESIYESLDHYLPKRRGSTVKSLPSSDGDTPPEVPPRPPYLRQKYKERMLRRQMPLPPIPTAHNNNGNFEGRGLPISTAGSAGNINTALHSLYKTTCRRNNFIFGQSSSCSTLPSFRMDSSEEDSVFEAQVESTPITRFSQPMGSEHNTGDTKTGTERGEENNDVNCNNENITDMSENQLETNANRPTCTSEKTASSTISGNIS